MLSLQEPNNKDNEEELAGAATALSLLCAPTDNSNSQHHNQRHLTCYCDHTHHYFLDYFNNPTPYDAVIYAGDIPFQYNKIEGWCTEFVGNPIGKVSIAVK